MRLTLIAVVLAVLVLAGVGHADQRSTGPHTGSGASGQVAGQPAPDPALPAIVNAAVTTTVTVQTHLAPESRRYLRPAEGVFTTISIAPLVRDDTSRPRAFPLLI